MISPFLLAHIAQVQESRDLGTLRDAIRPRPSRLTTIDATIGESGVIETLVDPGSQLNLLSAVIANEQNLVVVPLPYLVAESVTGDLTIYGTTTVDVTIKDSRGRKQVHEILFVVADLRKYKMYLGMPWIDQYRPRVNILSRRVLLCGTKDKDVPRFEQVGIEDAEQFEGTMRHSKVDVYACLVSFVGQNAPEEPKVARLPPQYAEYADVASEKDSMDLAEHSSHDLEINLVEGASPPYQPIYGLSEAELVVLRKYLTKFMARG